MKRFRVLNSENVTIGEIIDFQFLQLSTKCRNRWSERAIWFQEQILQSEPQIILRQLHFFTFSAPSVDSVLKSRLFRKKAATYVNTSW
jgi:hypothetical protein